MTRDRVLGQLDNQRLEIAARAAALALIYTVSALTGTADDLLLQLILLTVLAVAAVLPVRSRAFRRWRPAIEALVAGLIIGTVEPYDPSLLPYLVTPALSAGLIGGGRWPSSPPEPPSRFSWRQVLWANESGGH